MVMTTAVMLTLLTIDNDGKHDGQYYDCSDDKVIIMIAMPVQIVAIRIVVELTAMIFILHHAFKC